MNPLTAYSFFGNILGLFLTVLISLLHLIYILYMSVCVNAEYMHI